MWATETGGGRLLMWKKVNNLNCFVKMCPNFPRGRGGLLVPNFPNSMGGVSPTWDTSQSWPFFFNAPLSYFNLNIYLTYKSLFLLLISIFFQVDGPVVHSSNVHLFSKLKITMTTGKSEPFMNMYFFFFCGRWTFLHVIVFLQYQ